MNICGVIKSFGDKITEKIFYGEALTKKERKKLGDVNLQKAMVHLDALNQATEKDLLTAPSLRYHKLSGTNRYSIDTVRNSKWRITFSWENQEMVDVELVKIEDTHK